MRRLVLVVLMGCGGVPHRDVSAPEEPGEIDEPSEVDEADDGNRSVRAEDVPAPVRVAAASVLAGAPSIAYEKTRSGQYEAVGVVDGEEQDVTLSPGGWIIDTEEIDEIDDDDTTEVEAPAPDEPDDVDEDG